MALIKEPLFNHLRNKEQLGYIVQGKFDARNNGLAGEIVVQSNQFGPEYLESRINLVLDGLAKDKQPFKAD